MGEIPRPDLDTLKSEHLIDSRPIIACVGTIGDYGGELSLLEEIEAVGHNSDYHGDPKLLNRQGFKADSLAGSPTYVVSPIDERPKFTEELYDCTTLVAVGREDGTGQEVSFLTHQDPKWFLKKQGHHFEKDTEERLRELKERCLAGTVDIVIAGGLFGEEANYASHYTETLKKLTSLVKEVFGFTPVVVSGPKDRGHDNVYFDTAKRRLFVIRPEGRATTLHNESFVASDVNGVKSKWEQEEFEKKVKDKQLGEHAE